MQIEGCAFILVGRLNKKNKKKEKHWSCVPLVLNNWSNGPSEDGGFTLIPWLLIGADKAAKTRSSFMDNWVAQLNYLGADLPFTGTVSAKCDLGSTFHIYVFKRRCPTGARNYQERKPANQEKGVITPTKAILIF